MTLGTFEGDVEDVAAKILRYAQDDTGDRLSLRIGLRPEVMMIETCHVPCWLRRSLLAMTEGSALRMTHDWY